MTKKAEYALEKLAEIDAGDLAMGGAGLLGAGAIGYGGLKAYQGHQAAQRAKQLKAATGKAGMAAAALATLAAAGYGGLQGLRHLGGGSGRVGAQLAGKAAVDTGRRLKSHTSAMSSNMGSKAKNVMDDLVSKVYTPQEDLATIVSRLTL